MKKVFDSLTTWFLATSIFFIGSGRLLACECGCAPDSYCDQQDYGNGNNASFQVGGSGCETCVCCNGEATVLFIVCPPPDQTGSWCCQMSASCDPSTGNVTAQADCVPCGGCVQP